MKRNIYLACIVFLLSGIFFCCKETKSINKESEKLEMNNPNIEKATFGGGCFWCTEAIFERVEGVTGVVSGYAGGHKKNPTYKEVCEGTTGHAEVVQVSYDPSIISYDEITPILIQSSMYSSLGNIRWYGSDSIAQNHHITKNIDSALFAIKTNFKSFIFYRYKIT